MAAFLRALFLTVVYIVLSSVISGASSNIPVGSRLYADLERLEVKGLLDSAVLSSKPFSRSEAARLAREARKKLGEAGVQSGATHALASRLANEYGEDLPGTFVEPVRDPYLLLLSSDGTPYFTDVNNNGDVYEKGLNLRSGFSAEAVFSKNLTLFLNPEYRSDEGSSRGRILHGYLNLEFKGASLLIGRDSMWWGPGYHGDLLITNNSRPFDMVKLTSVHPFLLPGFLRRIGLVKPTLFLTRLDENRDFPRANLLGMRLDVKPAPGFQIGVSRVFMFGGEGRKSLGPSDWFRVLTASDSAEHTDSPVNGNQIASIDASYVYVNRGAYLPFSGIKLYTEWGAEDSSGETRSPTGKANIYGVYLDEPMRLSDTDLRIEWANTARNSQYGPSWYSHGIYTTGYTYGGRVIGHHMGPDARDLFIRGAYYPGPGFSAGLEADFEKSGVHSTAPVKRESLGVDLTYKWKDRLTVSGGLTGERTITKAAGRERNTVAWARLNWSF